MLKTEGWLSQGQNSLCKDSKEININSVDIPPMLTSCILQPFPVKDKLIKLTQERQERAHTCKRARVD